MEGSAWSDRTPGQAPPRRPPGQPSHSPSPRQPSHDPSPRRLSRDARHRQLVTAAMPLAARHGLVELSLDDVAARAGVTRNLLYHYFPRGRSDLALAVVTEAERQLTVASTPAQISQKTLAAMLDHALAPTHAWLIHRTAAASRTPAIRDTVAQSELALTRALASAHLGTAHPPPLAEAALRGYIGFAETAIDAGRASGLPRTELARLLDDMLAATLEAARRAQPLSSASHAAD